VLLFIVQKTKGIVSPFFKNERIPLGIIQYGISYATFPAEANTRRSFQGAASNGRLRLVIGTVSATGSEEQTAV